MPSITGPLQASGPLEDYAVVIVEIGLSHVRTHQRLHAGLPVPPPVRLVGVIDSGTTQTILDRQAVQSLGLQPRSPAQIITATGLSLNTWEYDVSLKVLAAYAGVPASAMPATGFSLDIDSLPILESSLSAAGVGALIGCDVLAWGAFTYDGKAGNFSFTY